MQNIIKKKALFYPPGGILIWLFIALEIVTFLGVLSAFGLQRADNMVLFSSSAAQLNIYAGTINTFVLLSSGFFVARTIYFIKADLAEKSTNSLFISILLGLLFLIIKGLEYAHKMEAGIGLEENLFFTYYWLLTGFHFIHVLFGIGILIVLYFNLKRGIYSAKEYTDLETGAMFWHMCDLIWLLIFPVLYLLN